MARGAAPVRLRSCACAPPFCDASLSVSSLWRDFMALPGTCGPLARGCSSRADGGVIPSRAHAHTAQCPEGDALMSTTILLAAALQKWERYSAHALAARDVAATLAKGTAHHLHVVSVYDYPPLNVGYIPAEVASRQQDELWRRTDTLMVQKLEAYIAPL